MARFNEQIEPIYVLLRETEDVNLSHELLEPEPAEIPALKQRSVCRASQRRTRPNSRLSSVATAGTRNQ